MNPTPGFAAVAIVEDDDHICAELQRILDDHSQTACVCACRSVRTALRRIPASAPDVILMDLSLGDGSGLDCTRELLRVLPGVRVIILTVHEDEEHIFAALRCGAAGYLLKSTPPEDLLRGIGEALSGHACISPPVAGRIVRSFRPAAATTPPTDPLTQREREILRLFSSGLLPKDVADRLDIVVGTVNTHLKHIYEKLNVRSRTEAVIRYLAR